MKLIINLKISTFHYLRVTQQKPISHKPNKETHSFNGYALKNNSPIETWLKARQLLGYMLFMTCSSKQVSWIEPRKLMTMLKVWTFFRQSISLMDCIRRCMWLRQDENRCNQNRNKNHDFLKLTFFLNWFPHKFNFSHLI